jgi:hypothetical protein
MSRFTDRMTLVTEIDVNTRTEPTTAPTTPASTSVAPARRRSAWFWLLPVVILASLFACGALSLFLGPKLYAAAVRATTPELQLIAPTPVITTDRCVRLSTLDKTFRSQGWRAWLAAAGLTWDDVSADARQIEEEICNDQVVAAGIQVKVKNLTVHWPAIVSTDDPSRIHSTASTRQHQPDMRNPSVLYTEVIANGDVTIWVDAANWGQLAPIE